VRGIEFSSSIADTSNCFFSLLKWTFSGSLDIMGAKADMKVIALTQMLIRYN